MPNGGHIGDIPSADSAMFTLLRNDPVLLEIGGDIDRTFAFTLDKTWLGPAIVSFYVIHANDDVNVEILLNGEGFSRRLRSEPSTSVHGVIESSRAAAAKDGPNELQIRVLHGSLFFSDLVLWYHSKY